MKKITILCLLVLACTTKVKKEGGLESFSTEKFKSLNSEERLTYAYQVVQRERRDPPVVRFRDFIQAYDPRLKRIGIAVFETILQPTRNGLSPDTNVYLSERGKQKLTKRYYAYWLNQLKLELPEKEIVSIKDLMKAKAYSSSGSPQPDYIIRAGKNLNDQDIFYMPGGKKTTTITTLNIPGARDLSALLVPASEFLATPKFAEHQKHWLNDLAKELALDALVVVQVSSQWKRGGVDKRTKEKIKEEMVTKIQASILVPWGKFHEVGELLKPKEDFPKVTISLGYYEITSSLPVQVSVAKDEESFETATKNILNPLNFEVESLSQLMILRMASDLRQMN